MKINIDFINSTLFFVMSVNFTQANLQRSANYLSVLDKALCSLCKAGGGGNLSMSECERRMSIKLSIV